MKNVFVLMLLAFVLTACGGSAPKSDADMTGSQVVGGDCPPCTSPNFDGLPPGGSPRAADDLPLEDASTPEATTPAEPDDSTEE